MKGTVFVLLPIAAVSISSLIAQQPIQRPPTLAVEPIAGILSAFKTTPVVALGEGDHGNEQGHRFRLTLIRDPRFSAVVNDIVVESGNAIYQDTIDRFVNGAAIADRELRRIWQDTSQVGPVWDTPIYEELFRAVRAVNASLQPARRLRVLLGDPPIEWSRVSSIKDVFAQMKEFGDRDAYPANVIRREVLAKGRRALVIYGDFHLDRTPPNLRPGCQPGSAIPCFPGTIVDRLEADGGLHVFNIRTITGVDLRTMQPTVASWPNPSLALMRSSALGGLPYRSFWPGGAAVIGPDGKPQPEAPGVLRPMEDVFDAVLYLGPPSTITYASLSPALCADREYVEKRQQRMAMGAGLGPAVCGQ